MPVITSAETSAPGKVVLSGEYAVLGGAPALVAAVDRRAFCRLSIEDDGLWTIESHRASWNVRTTLRSIVNDEHGEDTARFLRCLAAVVNLPRSATLHLDTSTMFRDDQKIGLGSSAATLCSIVAALNALSDDKITYDEARRAHGLLQSGQGSGLDIASSWHGGIIRFSGGCVEPTTVDTAIRYSFVFTRRSTSTITMLSQFAKHGLQKTRTYKSLCARARDVAVAINDSMDFISAMKAYISALRSFDEDSKLGIFGVEHATASSVADDLGVLYKPCGAGGGDLGVAMSVDQVRLDEFSRRIERSGLAVESMGITEEGVKVHSAA